MKIYRQILYYLIALTIMPVAAAQAESAAGTLLPFTTDGCSLSPDGIKFTKMTWVECCVKHDVEYWAGGTQDERLEADKGLRACIQIKTGNASLANSFFEVVRAGGGPYTGASYRWGYGWTKTFGYRQLTEEEVAMVNSLTPQDLSKVIIH